MRLVQSCFATTLLLFSARAAFAQSAPPVDSTIHDEPAPASTDTPEAPTGLGADLYGGAILPFGSASGVPGADLSKLYAGQGLLIFDVGGYVVPEVFAGVYGAFGAGGVGSDAGSTCNELNLDCTAKSMRLGWTIRYRWRTTHMLQPWVGYGFGYEWDSLSIKNDGLPTKQISLETRGWEFARFSVGIDFKLEPHLAVGPYVDLGFGQYEHAHQEVTDRPTLDGAINNTGLHEWLGFGLKLAYLP